MISEKNFTRASAATLQAEAEKTKEFIRKVTTAQIINVEDTISILATNQAMLEFAASELYRVLPPTSPNHNVQQLQQKAARVRHMGIVH